MAEAKEKRVRKPRTSYASSSKSPARPTRTWEGKPNERGTGG